ncbi:MAG: hypothetical protein V4527_10225 [Pseudomonadota bacterium]
MAAFKPLKRPMRCRPARDNRANSRVFRRISLARSANPVHTHARKIGGGGLIRKYWFEIFHFALWLVVGALLFFQQLIGIPALFFAITLCAVAFAINAVQGHPKPAFLLLAAPLAVLVLVLPLQRSGALNWVEFNLARIKFQSRVQALPLVHGEPRLIAFHMDDRGWQVVGASIFQFRIYNNADYIIETLVYDESSEIAEPPQNRSPAWRARAIGRPHFHSILQPVTPSHRVHVTAMGGHWFWVEQIFVYPRDNS